MKTIYSHSIYMHCIGIAYNLSSVMRMVNVLAISIFHIIWWFPVLIFILMKTPEKQSIAYALVFSMFQDQLAPKVYLVFLDILWKYSYLWTNLSTPRHWKKKLNQWFGYSIKSLFFSKYIYQNLFCLCFSLTLSNGKQYTNTEI